jgi:hypothetical protein
MKSDNNLSKELVETRSERLVFVTRKGLGLHKTLKH